MNPEEINTLIQAFALGCISTDELKRLHQIFQTENDIPWAELGMYQNMLALLPAISNLEKPGELVKQSLIERINKIRKYTIEGEFSESDYEEVKYIKEEKVAPPAFFTKASQQQDEPLHPIKVTKEEQFDAGEPEQKSKSVSVNDSSKMLSEEYGEKKYHIQLILIILCILSLAGNVILYFVLSNDITRIKTDFSELKSSAITLEGLAEANRKSIQFDIAAISEKAKDYYHSATNQNGGNNSFFGFKIPENISASPSGSFFIDKTEKDVIVIVAVGKAIGSDKVNPIKYSCTLDSSGKSEIEKIN
jgi:hypothetical protein